MSEPLDPRSERRMENDDTRRQMRQGQAYDMPDDRFDMLMPHAPVVPEEAREAAMEPLFNKKVMVVWAAFALALWFTVTVAVPAAFHSAKIAIREAVDDAGTASADGREKIIILPNGKRIVIRKDPVTHSVTITTKELDPAGVAAPTPVAPVVPPEAAAPPAPAATGGKKK
jgi:hypothetical protein